MQISVRMSTFTSECFAAALPSSIPHGRYQALHERSSYSQRNASQLDVFPKQKSLKWSVHFPSLEWFGAYELD